jgi:Tfp pilus assembly protein PilV
MGLEMRSQKGFSVVEALIATGILLIIAVGMIPLFTRSIANNAMGNDYTQASAHGKTDLERWEKMPFSSNDLAITSGKVRQQVKFVEKGIQQGTPVSDRDWRWTPVNNDRVLWTRTTQVRQFNISAFDDGLLTDAEALPAGTDDAFVQIKEVTTLLDSGKLSTATQPRTRAFSAIRQTSFQVMKPF